MTGQDPTGAVQIDTSKPHSARMYDWYLGGKDNYPVDEELGRQLVALDPRVPVMARVNRAFMQRATRWLAQQGIRQFLDIGTGIPTEPNLHQIAQQVAPDSRVVYCDNDPIVLAHAAALLRSTPEGVTDYVQGDVRDPASIIEAAAKVLDFSRPVALSLVALMHFIPDEYGAHELVAALVAELPAGSYLMMSHASADFRTDHLDEAEAKIKAAGITLALRPRAEIERFFTGLELVDPGVAVVHRWKPELGEPVPGQDDGVIPGYGVVGRKG
ncbi:SAM-dependent methyltransferase [Streptomyces sp. NPDC088387]|uniref:SAM-dependent methyltransferase n=1 Tax=Streptomyces sp. NPDC088387 TaxID=3365859 RepID=UPI0037F5BBC7